MKIYFAGSIRGGRDDQKIYSDIILDLGNYGSVLTEHVGDEALLVTGEQRTDSYIFDRDVSWVKESDIIIAEVTTPSLGVGYEIGLAESLGKRVVCVYRKIEGKRLSAMVAGNSKMEIHEYSSLDDLKNIFKKILS